MPKILSDFFADIDLKIRFLIEHKISRNMFGAKSVLADLAVGFFF